LRKSTIKEREKIRKREKEKIKKKIRK